MAKYLRPCVSAFEFGASSQSIRAFLPDSCQYYLSDLVARMPDTLVSDLNKSSPNLPERTGVAVFSGVLEFIDELPNLFDWLSTKFDGVIFCHAALEHTPSLINWRTNGRVNDHAQGQTAKIVLQEGFQGRTVDRWPGHVIFAVTRP